MCLPLLPRVQEFRLLIKPTQLSKHLSWTLLTKGLTPLFPSSSLNFSHPFIDATLTLSHIYIHILFKALDTFQAVNVFPVPVVTNSSRHSVHLPTTLILVFADFLHIALPLPSFLSHLHLRPSAPLSSNPCVMALVENSIPEYASTYTKIFRAIMFTISTSGLGSFYSSPF